MVFQETRGKLTTENSAKNRNLGAARRSYLMLVTVVNLHLRQRRDLANHGLTVRIPGAHHEPIIGLPNPDDPH